MYYHGARYYIPWLCRWTQCDPIGTKDGLNVYAYCSNNPVMLHDPSGMGGEEEKPKSGEENVAKQVSDESSPAFPSINGSSISNEEYLDIAFLPANTIRAAFDGFDNLMLFLYEVAVTDNYEGEFLREVITSMGYDTSKISNEQLGEVLIYE